MNLNRIIAINIRAHRKFNKLSQMDLAKKLKTTRQHIGQIESCNKNISIDMLERIASKLNVEPYQLLKISEDKNNDKQSITKSRSTIVRRKKRIR